MISRHHHRIHLSRIQNNISTKRLPEGYVTLFGRWELSFHDMELSGQVWCLMRVRLVLAQAYSKSEQFKWTSWTQLSLAKVWSLIHHFQYPMDKNPSFLPSTRMCSLVFFFFFLINTTLIIGEMTVESLIKNTWNLISVLSQRKQNNIMQSNKYYKNIHES